MVSDRLLSYEELVDTDQHLLNEEREYGAKRVDNLLKTDRNSILRIVDHYLF
jgi:hypothetical protein